MEIFLPTLNYLLVFTRFFGRFSTFFFSVCVQYS